MTRRTTHSWVVAGLLGMLCVASSSGYKPWAAAAAGAVVPADLAADVAAARLVVQGISPYGPVIRPAHAAITGLPLSATLPYFPHPPFSLIISFPLAFVSFQEAALLWFALTVALVFALAVLLHTAGGEAGERGRLEVWQLLLLLFAWPPVLYNLEKGQWSIMLATLLAFAWRSITRGDLRQGAVWAAVAASVKVFPVALGAFFLIRSVRALGWFAVTGTLLLAVPVAWLGFGLIPAFVGESRMNVGYWDSFPLVMFSVHGAITRALVGGRWAQPFFYAPHVAAILEIVVTGGLVAAALWISLQARRGRVEQSGALLVWLVLLPIVNPLSMGHNGVLLALPIVVLGHMISSRDRQWHRWAWALALVLVSIPNQSVWFFASPPTAPFPGLIATVPTCGALILYGLAIAMAHPALSGQASRPASGKITVPATISTIGRHLPIRSRGMTHV